MKLTLPQQDIYFEQLLHPEDPIYNIGAKIVLKGNIIYEILNEAYIALIDQHDAYRSVLVSKGDGVEMEILPKHNSVLGYLDFSEKENPDVHANAYMQETFVTPFDIASGEMLHKFVLIKVAEQFYYLFSMYHHIITDGWGTSLMFQRLVKNYNELVAVGKIETEYPFSYKEFVTNDLEYATSEGFESDKEYWKDRFERLPEPLFKRKDESQTINKSQRKELVIRRETYNKLETLAKEYRSSTFHIILSILFMYFGRKHQNKDFAIGLPVLNRGKSIFKKTVGLFMGVAALRISLDFESTFADLVGQIRQQLRQDYRHQRFPIGKLINELGLFQKKEGLFNITLSYEKQNYADHFKNTRTSVVPLSHEAERVALALYIREFDAEEDVKIDFDYNINYFDASEMEQVVAHFEQLAYEVIEQPQQKLSSYKYLTEKEEVQLLETFNDTTFYYPKSQTLLAFFNDQLKADPNKRAIWDGTRSYSYTELDATSNKLANALQKQFGTENKSPVAVLMNRSANMVATFLGILKTGRAFIPLDPNFPQERIAHILSHSDVKGVVGTQELGIRLDHSVTFMDIDEMLIGEDSNFEPIPVAPSETAYIIYTSGSTGLPKGVAIGHEALLNFLVSMKIKPGLTKEDVLFSVTTQSFDISILEFFLPLVAGASVYIASNEELTDPLALLQRLDEVKPSVIQGTPSFYQMLYNAGWKGDKGLSVLCGGDLLSESLAAKLLNTCSSLWNMYGPTETTIWSSCKRISDPSHAGVIGKPILNTQLYILDDKLDLQPTGVPGMLYIAGEGLAQGYYKNKELTDDKFIADPFKTGKRMYCTGDLARWNKNGEVVFMGRVDQQVKIRGYRIELGEVETALNALPEIKDSVVVAKKDSEGNARLIAYVMKNSESLDERDCLKTLREKLPEYMIPGAIMTLESFPKTPNNKIDRKELAQREVVPMVDEVTELPESVLEHQILQMYREVLGLEDDFSTTDSFFALGGHSLNAVKLISRIANEFQIQLSLRTIFYHDSVRALAAQIASKLKEGYAPIAKVTEGTSFPVTTSQYPMWLASQKKERSIGYNMFSVYQVTGELDTELLESAFKNIIDKYEILRTQFVENQGELKQKISTTDTNFKVDTFTIEQSLLEECIQSYVHEAFDLSNDLLVRLGVFKDEKGNIYVAFATHHIIMDAWSLDVLIGELMRRYKNGISNSLTPIPSLNFQFKDYAVWQEGREALSTSNNERYWKQYLRNYTWSPVIPVDHSYAEENNQAAVTDFAINKELKQSLEQLATKYNCSLHSLLLTAFTCTLHTWKGKEDLCIGTVNSGRNFPESESQIGMFVKTLPLRTRIESSQIFSEVLQRVHDDLLTIDEYQDIPESIYKSLRVDVLFVLQNTFFQSDDIRLTDDLKLRPYTLHNSYSRLPILFDLSEVGDALSGTIHYDTDKYEKATLDLLVLKYQKMLEQIVEQPEVSVGSLDIDLAFEKEEAIDISFNF
ncbi:amino acid adenylation domain-containing protein [Aureisphaera galaxeae]|uniref:amino acid adenylation domain-containing protein n=1 Tax=Aureisphaera galaxeae TaxID=1538023 RepID=UPI0023507E3B|nr:amino acid adenylation domain-containing protein [Aureisphaera galaxeae]MDC8004713.1 amino acid adenylation domain-containing protein [Aureisphaera galaxeae]